MVDLKAALKRFSAVTAVTAVIPNNNNNLRCDGIKMAAVTAVTSAQLMVTAVTDAEKAVTSDPSQENGFKNNVLSIGCDGMTVVTANFSDTLEKSIATPAPVVTLQDFWMAFLKFRDGWSSL
jgi:hypothetical protein